MQSLGHRLPSAVHYGVVDDHAFGCALTAAAAGTASSTAAPTGAATAVVGCAGWQEDVLGLGVGATLAFAPGGGGSSLAVSKLWLTVGHRRTELLH